MLQKKIVRSVIPRLEKGGYFLYITCSVFKQENETILEMIEKDFQMELIKEEVLKGYMLKADSMYGVLFKLRE